MKTIASIIQGILVAAYVLFYNVQYFWSIKGTVTNLINIIFFVTFFSDGNSLYSQNWSAMGTGSNSDVYAMTSYNGELIVAGDFTSVGGISANRIANWNGTTWSSLGLGTNGTVSALAVYNN